MMRFTLTVAAVALLSMPAQAKEVEPYPHATIVDHTINQGFDQYPQQGDKARSEIAAVKKMLDAKVIELFGPVEPGNEQILTMQQGLEEWFKYDRLVICPYWAWPNSSLPTTNDGEDEDEAATWYNTPSDSVSNFARAWQTKEPKLQTLTNARDRIVKAYGTLPESFPFSADDVNLHYVGTKHTPKIFNRQLVLELQLRRYGREKSSALYKAAYPYPAEIEENEQSYFLPRGSSYWYEYHLRYYQAAATKKADKNLPDYALVKSFEKTLVKLKMKSFLDRWRKRIKTSLEPPSETPASRATKKK